MSTVPSYSRATSIRQGLIRWVNEKCMATFGFTEADFATYFVSLAQALLPRSTLTPTQVSLTTVVI